MNIYMYIKPPSPPLRGLTKLNCRKFWIKLSPLLTSTLFSFSPFLFLFFFAFFLFFFPFFLFFFPSLLFSVLLYFFLFLFTFSCSSLLFSYSSLNFFWKLFLFFLRSNVHTLCFHPISDITLHTCIIYVCYMLST